MNQIISWIYNRYSIIQACLFIISVLAVSAFFSYTAFLSKGVLEPGDGIVHYYIAKYAPYRPALFLDHWGKPFFTLLSSPFAQIGFPGMIIFNSILFVITSLFIFLWAIKKRNPFSWIAPWLLLSSLVYMDMVNAGMTEILFGTILTITIYLFFNKRYTWGSILFSFAIFSRPEGNIILPIFFTFLLWKKQWKSLPFLGTGFIIYSIVGYFHYGDILWFFSKNPYPKKVPFYGNGELFHFIKYYLDIWGTVMMILCLSASIFLVCSLATDRRKKALEYLWLLVFPSLAVLCVHSYIWWKGIHGSLGLIRVIATIVPLFTILSLFSLHRMQKNLLAWVPEKYLFFSAIPLSIVLTFFLYNTRGFKRLPIQETPYQVMASRAAKWYLDYQKRSKVYYSDPYFLFKTGLGPFDQTLAQNFHVLDNENPALNRISGEIIVWEAHHGPNDGNISKEKITENPDLEVLKIILPEHGEQRTFKGDLYEIIIARVK